MRIRVTETAECVKLQIKTKRSPTPRERPRTQPRHRTATATAISGDTPRPLPHGLADAVRHMTQKLRRTVWFATAAPDGTYALTCGAVLGNKVQAYRRGIRTDGIVDSVINNQPAQCTFVTLTRKYTKDAAGRLESWQYHKQKLPAYMRRLKRHGLADYVWVKEAHYDGGCHVHLLCRWTGKFKTLTKNGVRRVRGKLKRTLKDGWDGHVDVQALDADTAGRKAAYIAKELGKYAHCEDALKRARRLWAADGDGDKQAADCKRLWLFFYGAMTEQRLYGAARRPRPSEPPRPEQTSGDCESNPAGKADLINQMTKTTAGVQFQVPWSIVRLAGFQPYAGRVPVDSSTHELLRMYEATGPVYGGWRERPPDKPRHRSQPPRISDK